MKKLLTFFFILLCASTAFSSQKTLGDHVVEGGLTVHEVTGEPPVLFVDKSTHRVGINVASPATALHVSPAEAAGSGITVQGLSSQTGDYIRILDSDGKVLNKIDSAGIFTTQAVQFDTSATEPNYSEGAMYWDGGIIQVDTDVAHLHYNPGLNLTTKVQNKTGVQIDKGKWVYINGSQGGNATIALASNDAEITSDDTLGITQTNIADNGQTYIVTAGLAKKQDTSGFAAGDKLYLGTSGDAVNSEPASPAHLVVLGAVKSSNANTGQLDVRVNVGWEIEELHNVLITSIADRQTLYYNNAASLWKNSTVLLVNEASGITIGNATAASDYTVVFDGEDNDYQIKFDEDGGEVRFAANGDITNYSTFESDGTLEFNGTATVFKDANIGAGTLSGPPGLQPGVVNFVDEAAGDTGIATFGIAVGEGLSGAIEMQHDYKEGSDITFHVHWQGIAAPTGTDKVQWQLTYTMAKNDATLDAPTTITKETDFDTQYEFKASAFAAITGTAFNIEDQFLFTLQRIAASADEYGGEALIATVGIHYECDSAGSRQINAK